MILPLRSCSVPNYRECRNPACGNKTYRDSPYCFLCVSDILLFRPVKANAVDSIEKENMNHGKQTRKSEAQKQRDKKWSQRTDSDA